MLQGHSDEAEAGGGGGRKLRQSEQKRMEKDEKKKKNNTSDVGTRRRRRCKVKGLQWAKNSLCRTFSISVYTFFLFPLSPLEAPRPLFFLWPLLSSHSLDCIIMYRAARSASYVTSGRQQQQQQRTHRRWICLRRCCRPMGDEREAKLEK